MSFHSNLIERATIKQGSDFAIYRSPRELAREEQLYYDRFPAEFPWDKWVAHARSFIDASLRFVRAATGVWNGTVDTAKLTH